MDIFVEQLVVRRNTKGEKIFKFIATAVMGLLAGLSAVGGFILPIPQFAPLGLVLAGGIFYLTFYLNSSLYIEFEYILTNGDFDVDSILSKKKRKRITSFDCKSVEAVEKYNNENSNNDMPVIMAANSDAEKLYCIRVATKNNGKAIIVIEPNEKLYNALLRCIPRQVAIKAPKWED